MNDDLDRLSGVLDDLAADRSPASLHDLTDNETALAATAAMLRAANPERMEPRDDFMESLAKRLATQRNHDQDVAAPATQPGVSRRSALRRAAAAVAGLAIGGAGATAAYERGKSDGGRQEAESPLLAPMVPEDRGSWQHIGYNVSTIAAETAVRFRAGALEGFLVNPGKGQDLYALSAACTHMGCMISWLNDAKTFLCPCHGAQYNVNGTVLIGIARHPLPRLRIKLDGDGDVYVWTVNEHPPITTVAPYTTT
jgi:cytochrome b6-f complex iron-sulfur subunit